MKIGYGDGAGRRRCGEGGVLGLSYAACRNSNIIAYRARSRILG